MNLNNTTRILTQGGKEMLMNRGRWILAIIASVLLFAGCGVSKEYVQEEIDRTRNEIVLDIDSKIAGLKKEMNDLSTRIGSIDRAVSRIADQGEAFRMQMLDSLELERKVLQEQLMHVETTIQHLQGSVE